MAAARGEYIRFLDSDDWLKPEANFEQLIQARNDNADLVVAGYEDFYEELDRLEPHPWVDCDDFVAQQFGEVSFSHYSAFLFRRSFIDDTPHRQEFALRDDRMFVLEVAIKKPAISVYRKPAFVHRHHGRGRLAAYRRIPQEPGALDEHRGLPQSRCSARQAGQPVAAAQARRRFLYISGDPRTREDATRRSRRGGQMGIRP